MKPGIRVVRGPDWCYSNQDGGPGFLGTVVKFLSNNRVVVVWDIGNVTECRAGSQEACDLRIYDNAQIGKSVWVALSKKCLRACAKCAHSYYLTHAQGLIQAFTLH